MTKTLRTSSLPQLKVSQQAGSYKHLIPKTIRASKPEQMIQIGSYVFSKQHLLGRGYCSAVYKGKNIKTDETVAIKIIEFDKIKGAVQKRLIKNQIKNLHTLKDSSNILKLLQVLTNKQYVAFITQICIGSLLQKLKSNNASKKSPLERTEAIKIMKQILNGYSEMRNHKLLHRDLKPANILISLDGEARIGDFGFSIRDEQVQQDKNLNIGSPLYMAPEVLKGNNYSSKADIWSIGLIFLEMLIGDLPWLNVKQSNLHTKLLEINIQSIIPQDLQEKYSQMLLKCLQVDPRKRMGIRQIITYFFTKQQLLQLNNRSKHFQSQDSSIKTAKISIPTSITQNQQQKSNDTFLIPSLQRTKTSIKNLYATSINNFSNNGFDRSSKAFSSRKSKLKDNWDSKDEMPISLKLKQYGPSQRQLIVKQQMSQLHFCRFLFKMVQLMSKGEDNIHNNYLNMCQQIKIHLAQTILYNLEQIRLIKSDLSSAAIKQFRKSKDFRKILQLTQQYQNNYNQFFQIQFKAEIEGRLIDEDYLIKSLSVYLNNGREHFELILEQVEKSQLKVITDNEICQFSYLMDFMAKLVHLLKLKKKGRQHFVKYGKIEELANTSLATISFSQFRKIKERLDK